MAREDTVSRRKRFGLPDPGPTTHTEVEKHIDGTAHVLAYNKNGNAKVHEHSNHEAAREHASQLKGQAWDED
jgi:hypothetical protein